jgi:hypothetical protein
MRPSQCTWYKGRASSSLKKLRAPMSNTKPKPVSMSSNVSKQNKCTVCLVSQSLQLSQSLQSSATGAPPSCYRPGGGGRGGCMDGSADMGHGGMDTKYRRARVPHHHQGVLQHRRSTGWCLTGCCARRYCDERGSLWCRSSSRGIEEKF